MNDQPTNAVNSWLVRRWLRDLRKSPDFWLGVIAFVAFGIVIVLFPAEEGEGQIVLSRDTWFAFFMGLLGSSVYLLYNRIRDTSEDSPAPSHTVVRLLLGPIAGWLAYRMGSADLETQQTTALWLPFLAGFSSDLLVGIINQMIYAIKVTLGIVRVEAKEAQGPELTVSKEG